MSPGPGAMKVGESSLERELIDDQDGRSPARRKRKKIAISLIGMGLGDRIILEAPLRMHRQNRPRDYLIGIVDRDGGPDLPLAVRRHFDELWWISAGNGQEWNAMPRTAVGRRIRDALVADGVGEVLVPPWKTAHIPSSQAYEKRPYNCFTDADYLRRSGIYPKVAVPAAERRWAKRLLNESTRGNFDALVGIHVRRVWFSPERNLDVDLIRRLVRWLRRQGRLGFLLLGRDDGPSVLSGRDIFSFVERRWTFEQTAAVIAQTRLFIGGESGLSHAAAALGVPLIGLGFIGDHARPFTKPSRYVYFHLKDGPKTILAGVARFVGRLKLAPAGRKDHGD